MTLWWSIKKSKIAHLMEEPLDLKDHLGPLGRLELLDLQGHLGHLELLGLKDQLVSAPVVVTTPLWYLMITW
jgi:hypothetical protein